MKKVLCVVQLALFAFPLSALASKKQEDKIQIVAPTEDRAFKFQGSGLAGAIAGSRTADLVFMVNAVIDGDHARLKCYENHRGCTALGPGEYDAEIEKDNVWIISTMPVTHKIIRDHWKVSGSW